MGSWSGRLIYAKVGLGALEWGNVQQESGLVVEAIMENELSSEIETAHVLHIGKQSPNLVQAAKQMSQRTRMVCNV